MQKSCAVAASLLMCAVYLSAKKTCAHQNHSFRDFRKPAKCYHAPRADSSAVSTELPRSVGKKPTALMYSSQPCLLCLLCGLVHTCLAEPTLQPWHQAIQQTEEILQRGCGEECVVVWLDSFGVQQMSSFHACERPGVAEVVEFARAEKCYGGDMLF